jgi:hypothetical protein
VHLVGPALWQILFGLGPHSALVLCVSVRRLRNIRPNPFIWDALDARKGEIEEKWLKAVTEIVEKVN